MSWPTQAHTFCVRQLTRSTSYAWALSDLRGAYVSACPGEYRLCQAADEEKYFVRLSDLRVVWTPPAWTPPPSPPPSPPPLTTHVDIATSSSSDDSSSSEEEEKNRDDSDSKNGDDANGGQSTLFNDQTTSSDAHEVDKDDEEVDNDAKSQSVESQPTVENPYAIAPAAPSRTPALYAIWPAIAPPPCPLLSLFSSPARCQSKDRKKESPIAAAAAHGKMVSRNCTLRLLICQFAIRPHPSTHIARPHPSTHTRAHPLSTHTLLSAKMRALGHSER